MLSFFKVRNFARRLNRGAGATTMLVTSDRSDRYSTLLVRERLV